MTAGRAERPWVLVTDGAPDHGQSRTTLWTVRALAAGGYRAAVTVSAPFSLAASSRYCDRSVRVPAVEHDAEAFAAAIEAELMRERYVTVLPTSDPALTALHLPGADLLDKSVLIGAAELAGIPCPPTEVFGDACELVEAGARLTYPVIVKPSLGHAAGRANGPADLVRWHDVPGPLLVQPYLPDGLHAVAGVVWGGEMVAAVHQRFLRTWPVDAGMTCAAVTTEPDPDVEAALLRLLRGYSGPFQADLSGPYLLDVNPRSVRHPFAGDGGRGEPHRDLLRPADGRGASRPRPVRAPTRGLLPVARRGCSACPAARPNREVSLGGAAAPCGPAARRRGAGRNPSPIPVRSSPGRPTSPPRRGPVRARASSGRAGPERRQS